MIAELHPLLLWLLPTLFFAPWVAGIAWLWRRLPADGWLPPSAGERARRRLLEP